MGIVDSLTAEPEIIEAKKKACNCNCHENKTPDENKDHIKDICHKEEDNVKDICHNEEDHIKDICHNEEESGDEESGDEESGDEESGDEESGDEESGDEESGDEESGDEESGDEEEEGINNPIPDSQIYVVCINNVPYFYAKTLTDAQEKARNTLLNMYNDNDRTYYIEEEDSYTMNLSSTYHLFVINYDRLEATCKIHYVTQITQ